MYISFVTLWKDVLWKKSDAYQFLAIYKAKTISNSMDYLIRKQVI
jgi:hypothetical protein